jgi:hypothetical protein
MSVTIIGKSISISFYRSCLLPGLRFSNDPKSEISASR